MRQRTVSTLFVCFAALLLVFACADSSKKPAETPSQTAEETTETPTQTAEETTETPSQTAAETSIEEITLNVTGMT